MAARSQVSNIIFEKLVKHLVDIEEQKNKLFEEYFREPSKEREDLKKLFENYVKTLEHLVTNANKTETPPDTLPFVTIGSEVEVQDLETQERHRLRLVSPFASSLGRGDISYLSPVGKSLLLKKVGDRVTVQAPGGVFHYKVLSVQMRAEDEQG